MAAGSLTKIAQPYKKHNIYFINYFVSINSIYIVSIYAFVLPDMKWSIILMGMGKMMVELCSAEMLLSVWR